MYELTLKNTYFLSELQGLIQWNKHSFVIDYILLSLSQQNELFCDVLDDHLAVLFTYNYLYTQGF